MLLLAPAALAATLQVGPTRTYTTVTAAVAAARSGDTVEVDPGEYVEDPDFSTKALIVRSTAGSAWTTLVTTKFLSFTGGSFEGFTVETSAKFGLYVPSGSPTLREVIVRGATQTGIRLSGGSPVVEELLVVEAGTDAFLIDGGTPTVRRCIAWEPGTAGFAVSIAGTYSNLLAVGGVEGFRGQTTAQTFDHAIGLDASSQAISAYVASTWKNGVFGQSPLALRCYASAKPSLPNGIATNEHLAQDCAATVLDATVDVAPGFTSWASGSSLHAVDLRPKAGSAMIDAGNDTDADASTGDLGIFGGAYGEWSDTDADGQPVLFDCDDRDATSFWGATEREDGLDNDCDGRIDDDIPVDTGGDTGDTGDTGGDTGADTGAVDLDGDGYPASSDCSEHNVATHPGAPERTDGADNDCDGAVDEGTITGDDDGDGASERDGDCDDTDPEVRAGVVEPERRDGIDQDCDGADDYAGGFDGDADGVADTEDCDDTDATIPAAADPTDGRDNDCDGQTDEDEHSVDRDGDGLSVLDGDCDDTDAAVHAGATDVPDDFIDQDCTGEDNYDLDRDGDPAPASGGTDCDDTRSNVNPGAAEVCDDLVDNNCDGTADEACDVGGGAAAPAGDCSCSSAINVASTWTLGVLLATVSQRRRHKKSMTSLDGGEGMRQ